MFIQILENLMSNLEAFKLVQAKRPINIAPILFRRQKLGKRIWEQLQLAKAQAEGKTFTVTRYKTVRNNEQSKTVELTKQIKQWWWVTTEGKLCLAIRYGNKVIELAKNKNAIEVSSNEELISVLTSIQRAVEKGELDSQIEQASNVLRAGFIKRK